MPCVVSAVSHTPTAPGPKAPLILSPGRCLPPNGHYERSLYEHLGIFAVAHRLGRVQILAFLRRRDARLMQARRLATVARSRCGELFATGADGHVCPLPHRLGWNWHKPTGRAGERDEQAICRAKLSMISSVTPGGTNSYVSFCRSVAGQGLSRTCRDKNRLTRGLRANRLQALSSEGLRPELARVLCPSDMGRGAQSELNACGHLSRRKACAKQKVPRARCCHVASSPSKALRCRWQP